MTLKVEEELKAAIEECAQAFNFEAMEHERTKAKLKYMQQLLGKNTTYISSSKRLITELILDFGDEGFSEVKNAMEMYNTEDKLTVIS